MKPLVFPTPQVPGREYIWRHIPGHGKPWVDPRSADDLDISTFVNQLSGYMDDAAHLGHLQSYTVPDRVLVKWGRLFDIVLPSSRRSCCFTRGSVNLRPMAMVQSILTMSSCQDIPNWSNEQVPSCKWMKSWMFVVKYMEYFANTYFHPRPQPFSTPLATLSAKAT